MTRVAPGAVSLVRPMSDIERRPSFGEAEQHPIRGLTDDLIEFIAKLALLGFLVYWAIVLIRPFIPIVLWSLIFTVTLYPVYEWLAFRLGGRQYLAAAIIVAIGIVVFAGPAVWLGLSMMEGLTALSERLNSGTISVPPPPDNIKTWPLIGERLHGLWDLASTNLKDAFHEALPYLKPLRGALATMAQSAATAIPLFFVSLLIAGLLFPRAPSMLKAVRTVLHRIIPSRGQEFISLAGATDGYKISRECQGGRSRHRGPAPYNDWDQHDPGNLNNSKN